MNLNTRLTGGIFALAFPLHCAAEELPLWEIGLGGGALTVPDYRGSDESRNYVYPFFFPIYRGERLRSDEEGIRGKLFESERLSFDFSLDGSVPVKGDNAAREGMPDLAAVGQIGPRLQIKLWDKPEHSQSLILKLPLRAAFAFDNGIDYIGATAFPGITYYRKVRLNDAPWKMGLTAGVLWGSEKFHDYYYQVDPEYATPERPAYDAGAGFSGSRLVGTFYKRDKKKLISFYAVYDDVSDATFEDSPLVKQNGGLTAGFLISWSILKSRETVDVENWEWK